LSVTLSPPRPTFLRDRLAGVEAILLPCRGTGLIALQVLIRRGTVDETPGEHGLASFTAGMLKRGTARRSSAQLAYDLESLGALTSHAVGADAAHALLRAAAADFPEALAILFECLREPAFDPAEIDKERQSVLAHLLRVEDEKFEFTYRRYVERLFAGHAYGHLPEGTAESVRAITAEACRVWHARAYRPENMLLAVAGDFEPDQLRGWLGRLLEDWPDGRGQGRCQQRALAPGPGADVSYEKELEQGFVVLGYRLPEATHPDRLPLRLACCALGEGFAGRLFSRLRDARSLAYAVGSGMSVYRLGGHMTLYIGTEPGRLEEARAGLVAEVEAIRREGISEEELERARQYVAGKFLMAHQSLADRAAFLAGWEDLGLGAEYDARYVEDLRRVGAEQVVEAARRWWVEPTIVTLRPAQPD